MQTLDRLAKHRQAKIIRVEDLAALHRQRKAFGELQQQLRDASPRYVAVAPRLSNFRENTLLCLWELLAGIDEDPQLDAFPGLLVALSSNGLSRLVDSSINLAAKPPSEVNAFGVCQISGSGEPAFRSLQKIEMLKRHFAQSGPRLTSLTIGPQQSLGNEKYYPQSESAPTFEVASAPRQLLSRLPEPPTKALDKASLVVLFGHGAPGMVCGMRISALKQTDFTGKVVLSGSCIAGVGNATDIPQPQRGPDGSVIRSDREKFALTTAEGGAALTYGHMRLSNGFRSLAPLLEGLLDGQSAGETYQRLLNALIESHKFQPEYNDPKKPTRGIDRRMNPFLHVLIADPAIAPYAFSAAR